MRNLKVAKSETGKLGDQSLHSKVASRELRDMYGAIIER